MSIIDFILGLFRKKDPKLKELETKKKKIEQELEEIENEKDNTDANISYLNNK